MNPVVRAVICAYLPSILLLIAGAGCSSGTPYHAGRKAEKRGDAHMAYDNYCRAALNHAGSSAIAAGIKRTHPAAAAFWEAQATAAAEEGRYVDAWRMWMRMLEIRPDHPTAPQMIRQLQEQHAVEIAHARADWLRRGTVSLATARPTGLMAGTRGGKTGTGAEAGIDASTIASATASPTISKVEPEPDRVTRDDALVAAVPKPASFGVGSLEGDTPAQAEIGTIQMAAESSGASGADAKHIEPQRPEPAVAAQPKHEQPKRIPIADLQSPEAASGSAAESRRKSDVSKPQHEPPRTDEFLVVLTLSRKDHRYPKQARLIDGITVKLKDTDDDLDADLNLYDGKKRIKKIRELPIGRSKTFRIRSGRRYRLTILSIHHKTHTVRIGIKPA